MREKPPITRRAITQFVRQGYASLSIDRELLEYLKAFSHSRLGEFVELKGFVVLRDEGAFLKFGLGTMAMVKLAGLDERLASVLRGEPVVVQGFKIGRLAVKVEKVSVTSIVKLRPYADYRYLRDVALDGVELDTPEECAILCLISSPRPSPLVAGGARQAILGSKRSYFDRRLRSLTISSPCVWRFGKVALSRVEVVKKAFRRYAEVSANVDSENASTVVSAEVVDFPSIVRNAPRESIVDFDAIDYTLWVKGLRPRLEPVRVRSVLEEVSKRLASWLITQGVDARLKLFSVDYEARPSTVLRIAFALARVEGRSDPLAFIDRALSLVEKSLGSLLEEVSANPRRVIRVRDVEKALLKVLEKFEPRGATALEVARELGVKNLKEVEQLLERLRARGLVYCPRPGIYRVTPL